MALGKKKKQFLLDNKATDANMATYMYKLHVRVNKVSKTHMTTSKEKKRTTAELDTSKQRNKNKYRNRQ